ncbi:MAG: hypothetical protein IKO03_12160 [Lachnospiraceae bacterium]|nr:hypothetical protein [Lachnospiraceae bacterium]
MSLIRIFSGDGWKGTKNYLKTQRVYEILRTILFFSISGALFAAGWISTGSRLNLLTVVAVLGILPASKAAVSAIMFCRYKSLSEACASKIEAHVQGLTCLYDMVFTGREKNFPVGHLTIKGNTVCGYTESPKFDEQAFYHHLDQLLKIDSFKNVNVKIFTDLQKYIDRLDQMQELSCDETNTKGISDTLRSVSL